MYYTQAQLEKLKSTVRVGKVTVVYGPRRVGKTTLLRKYLDAQQEEYLFVSGEDIFIHQYLSSNSIEKLKDFIGKQTLLVIDEAQYIPNIGINLKLIVDHVPNTAVIATGSSTFDLAKQLGDPLTGRKSIIKLFPLSQLELEKQETRAETAAQLEKRLRFGSYPEVITLSSDRERQEYIRELISSYLYKDILQFEGMHKSKKMIDLLQLLAFQIGKEVSLSELGNQLGLNKQTVERHLDLLEQVFVIINIRGFSRNLRKEITKTSRYYFYDVGIRNGLINNFNSLALRNDIGQIWENYLVIERIKKQEYLGIASNNYFWRTYDQKELDWVEEREGKLFGFEFKWGKDQVKAPQLWLSSYPQASFEVINQENYLRFIS